MGASGGLLAEQSAARFTEPGNAREPAAHGVLGQEAKPCLEAEGSFAAEAHEVARRLQATPPERHPAGPAWEPGDPPQAAGLKLTSLDSNSVGEWLCHPHPVPGLGGWVSGILPQGAPAFLGRGHKASAPPPHVSAGGGSRAAQGPHMPSPAGLPPRLWTDRTCSAVILANTYSTASVQFINTLL